MKEVTPGTYAVEIPEPWVPEVQYKFVVDGRWMPDPRNPDRADDGHGGFNSVRRTGFQEDPWLQAPPAGGPRWAHEALSLKAPDGSDRKLDVLLPPVGTPSDGRATLYFTDGRDYLERTGVGNLIEHLSAQPGMPVLAAVFVPPRDRMTEYAMSDATVRFLADDVVSAVERRFPVTAVAREGRVVIGASMGGLISLYAAIRRPEVFGRVVSQSGSLWWENGKILPLLQAYSGPPLGGFLSVGVYETPDMEDSNRLARDAIAGWAGSRFGYEETPTTHDWIGWRNHLRRVLTAVLGKWGRS
jgi:enterochelin esterase family protein